MKIIRKLLKILLLILIIIALVFAAIIIYAVISDYKPKPQEEVFRSENADRLNQGREISLLTWNIGYCGLDKQMDFFYDGGKKVFTPRSQCIQNLNAVISFLKRNDSIDFFLIQEIDRRSKRSYHINEFDSVRNNMGDYHSYFATNYDVFFVPVPPANPMGKVESGLAVFTRFQPASSVRYSFPGEYGFPKQLFMLDRCFLVNRYPLDYGKELLIINTHNEAYDPGQIRKAQMDYLRNFLLSEYRKGNYLIVGGDWNQAPPQFEPEFAIDRVKADQMKMSADYLPPEWKWVFDDLVPTNRSVDTPYEPGKTTATVIDLFLLSPNIESLEVKGIDLQFNNSDHNPVRIKVKLN